MSGVSSPGGAPEGIQPPYKSQYAVSPEFRKFWESLFKGAALTDKQVSQMTDQFVKNVWSQMSQVLNWALEQQKKRNQEDQQQG